jgi:hypothetical protein
MVSMGLACEEAVGLVLPSRVVVEGISVSQVAVELDITANDAMVRLHRARTALKAKLKAHCGTTSLSSCADCGCAERGCCPQA